jgi:hypothetical protein
MHWNLMPAGTLDGIIDTVSAKHDLTALTALLAPPLTDCQLTLGCFFELIACRHAGWHH